MAQSASKIITMLPSTPQVEQVYLDPTTGILAGLGRILETTSSCNATAQPDVKSMTSPHTVLIDQTTLDPTAAVRIANFIHERTGGGTVMLDAPVSGGMSPFRKGSV
jgi:3-hydroxyisobutyrate dehydrogenase